jgi:transcriptional repressor NrdR
MVCPRCNHTGTEVIDSRMADKSVRRRRSCSGCNYRFTTFERVERPRLLVIKKDQRREPFSRDKLLTGIERACEKRPVSKTEIEAMVDEIECAIFDQTDLEISTNGIGELVMIALAKRDKVAYVRFASVYREFTDVASFAKVVEMLETN